MDVLGLLIEDDGIDLNQVLGIAEVLAEPLQIVDIQPAEERRQIVRNEAYYEETVPRYDDISFQEHFRMSRQAFQILMGHITNIRPNFVRNVQIELEKKVLFTIWILSKQESFLACGDRFGMPRSTAYYVFKEIVEVLVEMLPQHIVWPNNHETAVEIFRERSHGFPGIIGAIGSCHIKIKQPVHNRNKYHSLILQGVADHHAKFIDIFVGLPGHTPDARVFRNSEIYEKLSNEPSPLLPRHLHLLGDSAYPLMPNLMTPFRDNGHLTARESNYNTKLNSVRSIIERAFGKLKGKFSRLKDLDVCTAEMGTQVVAAACVLHNHIIEVDNDDEVYESDQELIDTEEVGEENHLDNRQLAALKRNKIMNNL